LTNTFGGLTNKSALQINQEVNSKSKK